VTSAKEPEDGGGGKPKKKKKHLEKSLNQKEEVCVDMLQNNKALDEALVQGSLPEQNGDNKVCEERVEKGVEIIKKKKNKKDKHKHEMVENGVEVVKKQKNKKDKHESPLISETSNMTENAESSKEEKSEVSIEENGQKKKKKKQKGDSSKVFEELGDWDVPLKEGEQEIVVPNKKYKGNETLKPASEALLGFPGFDPPKIKSTPTPSKSMTSVFLKKAISKSASPKLKKSKLDHINKRALSMSEQKKKKVNFALTMNKSQDITAFATSVASSPSVPHDPNKNPVKPLLKSRESTPSRIGPNSVQVNTQLNSKSKTAKKRAHLRSKAMDFF